MGATVFIKAHNENFPAQMSVVLRSRSPSMGVIVQWEEPLPCT